MKTLNRFLLLLTLTSVLILGNGCFLDSMVKSTGTPTATNYYPHVLLVTNETTRFVTNVQTILVTNTVTGATVPQYVPVVQPITSITYSAVTNLVPVIEYGMKPGIQTGLAIAQGVAEASGIPWAGLAVGTIGSVFGALFGISNKRRAAEAMGKVNVMETVSSTLVDNVEAMKKLAINYATQLGSNDPTLPARVNEYANNVLIGAQKAADVEDFVRKLVHKQTGYTQQETGILPAPAGSAIPA